MSIATISTQDIDEAKKQLESYGFVLCHNTNRVIVTGKKINGTVSDIYPPLELVGVDGRKPIMHTVIMNKYGIYEPYNGVCFTSPEKRMS